MSTPTKIIGICGGSCSGKTTLSRKVVDSLSFDKAAVLYQDSYYKDMSDKFDFDGGSINFDHPNAIDFELLEKHIIELKEGNSVNIPQYDFATHKRSSETQAFPIKDLILLDGILILSQPRIVELLDYSIFVECKEELRLERRLKRDVEERGRSEQGVKDQFKNHVEPMHKEYVEASKVHATRVIPQDEFLASFDQIVNEITNLIILD